MRRYVKICPHCGHQNPERNELCDDCGTYLMDVAPTVAPETGSAPRRAEAPPAPAAMAQPAPPPLPPSPQSAQPAGNLSWPPRPPQPPAAAPSVPANPGTFGAGAGATPVETVTRRGDERTPHLTLEHRYPEQSYVVQAGWTVGRHDATSPAQVKLGGIPGSDEIHREHCRFERHGTTWYVVALDQRQLRGPGAFTNHTYLNGVPLQPGAPHPLRHGDALILSKVTLTVLLPNEG